MKVSSTRSPEKAVLKEFSIVAGGATDLRVCCRCFELTCEAGPILVWAVEEETWQSFEELKALVSNGVPSRMVRRSLR